MSLLQNIWKNKVQILEGLINRVQAKEEVEQIAKQRLSICKACPYNSTNAKSTGYKTTRPDDHCLQCGCNLDIKTHCLSCECPLEKPKWTAVATRDEANLIQDIIKEEKESTDDNKEHQS